MNRCGSFPLLFAPHSLFSIWTNLKRCEKILGAPTRRWGEWICLTGPSGLHRNSPRGVKYQFHQGFWPDQRAGNPIHALSTWFTFTNTLTRSHRQTHTRILTHSHSLTHIHTHTHAHTHAHTHTHAHRDMYKSGKDNRLSHGCAEVAHCVPARWRNFSHYCRPLRQYDVFWAQRSTDRRSDSRRCTHTSD